MKKISTTPIKFWLALMLLIAITSTIISEIGFLMIIAWFGGMVTSIRKFNQLGINNLLCTLFCMFLTGIALIVAWIKISKHNREFKISKTAVVGLD